MKQRDLYVEKIKESGNNATFAIEPLATGYGYTIGNSIRRVLLSSLEGSAIDYVVIEGADHEFSSLKGIKEDVVEILINLKKLRFDLHTDEAVLILNKKKKGSVTASAFEKNAECVPQNKDQHIATIESGGELDMRIHVKKGSGYELVDEKKSRPTEVGTIVIDSAYSPIVAARYTVEKTRVGQETDLDKILIEIETDGSITPEDAMTEATTILVKHFSIIGKLPEKIEEEIELPTKPQMAGDEEVEDIVVYPKTKIEDTPLSSRTANALLTAGYKTVSGLLRLSDIKLESIKGLGLKGLYEVKAMLAEVKGDK